MKTLIIDLGSHSIRTAYLQANGAPRRLADPDLTERGQAGGLDDPVTPARVGLANDEPYPGWSAGLTSAERTWQFSGAQLGHPKPVLADWHAEWLLASLLKKIRRNAHAQLADEITRVLLPQPSGIGLPARRALQRAALWAGYAEACVSEAPLATLSLFQTHRQTNDRGYVFVVDIGHQALRIDLIEVTPSGNQPIDSRKSEKHAGGQFVDELKIYVKNELQRHLSIGDSLRHYEWDELILQLIQDIGNHPEQSCYSLGLSSATGLINLSLAKNGLERWFGPMRSYIETTLIELCQVHGKSLETFNGILLAGAGAKLLVKESFGAQFQPLLRTFQPTHAALMGSAFHLQGLASFSEQLTPLLSRDLGYIREPKAGSRKDGDFNCLLSADTPLPAIAELNMRGEEPSLFLATRKEPSVNDSPLCLYGAIRLLTQKSWQQEYLLSLTILAEFDGLLLLSLRDSRVDNERYLMLDHSYPDAPQPSGNIWRRLLG